MAAYCHVGSVCYHWYRMDINDATRTIRIVYRRSECSWKYLSGEESWQTNWSILLPCFAADVFGWPDVHWNPLVEVIYHQRLWICHCKPTTNSRGNWWLWRYSTFTNESVQAFSERIIAVIEPMHSEFENGAGLQERDYSYEWISIGNRPSLFQV